MYLETERLILRSFTMDDLGHFAAMQADADVMHYVGGIQTFEESTRQLREIIHNDQETGLARFAVEKQGAPRVIGYCGFKPAGDFIDLGYQYRTEAWGQGFGLEAAKAVRENGLGELGITNMEAGGSINNLASVKIMQQLAFTHCEDLVFEGQPAIRFFD